MGYLKLILGPMFSGKSTKLIELIRKYKVINYKIMIIKNGIDNRYSDEAEIVSHNKDTESCIVVDDLNEIKDDMINDCSGGKFDDKMLDFVS